VLTLVEDGDVTLEIIKIANVGGSILRGSSYPEGEVECIVAGEEQDESDLKNTERVAATRNGNASADVTFAGENEPAAAPGPRWEAQARRARPEGAIGPRRETGRPDPPAGNPRPLGPLLRRQRAEAGPRRRGFQTSLVSLFDFFKIPSSSVFFSLRVAGSGTRLDARGVARRQLPELFGFFGCRSRSEVSLRVSHRLTFFSLPTALIF